MVTGEAMEEVDLGGGEGEEGRKPTPTSAEKVQVSF